MQIKIVFLFVCFLSLMFLGFDVHSSNASHKEKSFCGVKVKSSLTRMPKSETNFLWKSIDKKPESPDNKPPKITALSLWSNDVYQPCEDEATKNCPSTGQVVDIDLKATDSDGDTLLYGYDVKFGKIIGDGTKVKWDLSGVPSGKYEIVVSVDDGHGGVTTEKRVIEINECFCKPVPKPIPTPDKDDPRDWILFGSTGRPNPCRKRPVFDSLNTPPKVEPTLSSSTVYLPCADGKFPEDCPNEEKALIDISANATDPDGDTLLYTYSVTGGKIIGDGYKVQWDLSGVKAGKHTVTIQAEDGMGGVTTQTKDIEVFECKCKPKCISLSVGILETNNMTSDVVTFVAALSEPVPNAVYRWTISAGKIIKNEGTSIVVDRKGTGGQLVTATLKLEGLPDDCPNTASASTDVAKRDYAIVEGYINIGNKPAQGVKVVLMQFDAGGTSLEDATNDKGKFSFRVFNQGTYKLQVFKNGYYMHEKVLTVEKGQQVQIPTISLRKR